jgi:hypothetical protein
MSLAGIDGLGDEPLNLGPYADPIRSPSGVLGSLPRESNSDLSSESTVDERGLANDSSAAIRMLNKRLINDGREETESPELIKKGRRTLQRDRKPKSELGIAQ